MMTKQTPLYFRDVSYLYSLKSHPTYGFCVGRNEKVQAIWGLVGWTTYLLVFSSTGDLLNVQQFSSAELGVLDSQGNSPDQILQAATRRFMQEYELSPEAVAVKRCWIGDAMIGIEDVTDNIKESIQFPSSFTDEELEDCSDSLNEWKADEQFVLWWAQSYYVSKEGDVETS
jgi:hypothetical protein